MEDKKFSVGEAIGYGARTFIDHFGILFGSIAVATVTYLLLKIAWVLFLGMIVFSGASTAIIDSYVWGKINLETFTLIPPMFFFVYIVGSFFLLLIYFGLWAGLIRLIFNLHDKNAGTIGDVFSQFNLAPRIWITSILYYLIFVGGLILLVVPGIYWAIRFSLYPYFIVDNNTGSIESLRKSYGATVGHTVNLLGIFVILFFINFIPLVGPILGGFLTPLVLVYVYRRLTAQEIAPIQ